jgi:hypothetical protein
MSGMSGVARNEGFRDALKSIPGGLWRHWGLFFRGCFRVATIQELARPVTDLDQFCDSPFTRYSTTKRATVRLRT